MRKFLLLTLLASLPMIGMNAQHTLRMYGEDISMGVGEKPTMFINLDVDKDEFYHISKFTIVLPKGFSVTKNNRGKTPTDKTTSPLPTLILKMVITSTSLFLLVSMMT